jgi:hypothetical protein
MLKIPQIGQRPKQSDFCVSKDDIDKYLVAKKNFEVDKRRREEKKSHSSCVLSLVIIFVIALIIFTLIEHMNNSYHSDGQAFLWVIFIAICVSPFIIGFVSRFSNATVDLSMDKPSMVYSPNQNATKFYQEAVEKYEKITKQLKNRYANIEMVDYDEGKYTEFVVDELIKILDKKFNYRNITWWSNQILNFKIAINKILRADGFQNVRNMANLSNPIDAAFSKKIDIIAQKDGYDYFIICFSKTNGVLEIKYIEEALLAIPNCANKRIIIITNYMMGNIAADVMNFIEDNSIDLWDAKKMVELTKKYFVDTKDEYPLELGNDFKKCIGFKLSSNINDRLLSTQSYFYYIYTLELFNSAKEALEAMQRFPKDKVYYGICEYPNAKFWLYDGAREGVPESVCYMDESPRTSVYAIIASSSENRHNWRIRVESEYIFDAYSRKYFHNHHTLYTHNGFTHIPTYLS